MRFRAFGAALVAACSISFGGAVSADGRWNAAISDDGTIGNIHGRAIDGKTMFYGACNTRLQPGLSGSILGYVGNALPRVDQATSRLVFAIRPPEGVQEFSTVAHYYKPDYGWVWNDPFPPVFMEALRRGGHLTVSNGGGAKIAGFDLNGIGRALAVLASACGDSVSTPSASKCTPIHSASGASSATVTGMAPSDTPFACYTFTAQRGQTATIRLTQATSETAFNIGGVVDGRVDYSFETEAKTYKIDVYQFNRGRRDVPFAMEVSIK